MILHLRFFHEGYRANIELHKPDLKKAPEIVLLGKLIFCIKEIYGQDAHYDATNSVLELQQL